MGAREKVRIYNAALFANLGFQPFSGAKLMEFSNTAPIKPLNQRARIEPATIEDLPRLVDLTMALFELEEDFKPDRKKQERGLRSILEQSLIDTMYELPSVSNVEKVVVDESTIEENQPPLLVYHEAAKKA